MSITDELRKWLKSLYTPNSGAVKDEGERIADRIDAEHEAMLADVRKTVYQGLIELPKDADGEYIRVEDRLDGYGKTIEVVEMRHGRSGWVLISRDGNGYADTFAFTHHAPTVEDVLCDLLNEYRENECTLEEARLSEYVAKLRLVEESSSLGTIEED